QAIGEAHRLQIVHRDLKPSNLFLCDKPAHPQFVKVLDFGISKIGDVSAEGLTQTDTLLGSPAYAPPEQLMASRTVDSRADIWALGVVLHRSLTGQLPFAGHTLAQVCTSILQEPAIPVRALRAEIPSRLEAIVSRCLQKEPAQRFATIEELVQALSAFAPAAARACLAYLAALPAAPMVKEHAGPTQPSSALASNELASSPESPTLTAGAMSSQVPAPQPHAKTAPRRAIWLIAPIAVAGLAVGVWVGRGERTQPAPNQDLARQATPAVVPSVTPAISVSGADSSPTPSVASPSQAAPSASATLDGATLAATGVRGTAQPKRAVPKSHSAPSSKPAAANQKLWVDSR
ncbi:MAG TPA: protein kinase, partial [Polyangiaceae bacterium]